MVIDGWIEREGGGDRSSVHHGRPWQPKPIAAYAKSSKSPNYKLYQKECFKPTLKCREKY